MTASQLLEILTIQSLPGISKTIVERLVNEAQFTSITLEELFEAISLSLPLKKPDWVAALKQAEQILEESQKADLKVIGIKDPTFPQQLRIIQNPPLILYIKGEIECLHQDRLIAIIGTRTPSKQGEIAGKQIAKIFTEWGWTIVSGLALGCDTAAHEGCLEAGGKTIAFVAHGLDTIYPEENTNLAQRIIELGGCLVSEYPLGQKVLSHQFIERDRLQSGLSSAVIVVETEIKGSTMHTVNFSLDQNKHLACLNYNGQYASSGDGNHSLITEGKAFSLWELETLKDFETLVLKNSRQY